MAIRVVVADDAFLVREAVTRLLSDAPDIEPIAAVGESATLVATIEHERPDVVVTDIRMPPTGEDEGIRVASRLRMTHPEIGVVVLSQYAEPAYILELLESGSAGRAYLLKERVNAIFIKLGLSGAPDVSSRVTAALMFLAESADAAGSQGQS